MNTLATRILIVDDEAPIRQVCARALRDMNCDVETSGNAEDALERFQSHRYDIVITDLRMPGKLSGNDLLDEIKRRSPRTEVVIMTGFPTVESAIPAFKHGATDYLIKPFHPLQIRETVSRCSERQRATEARIQDAAASPQATPDFALQKELHAMKESFLARVQHELRTPLTSALFAVDMLSRASAEPEHQRLCGMLHGRLEHLASIISQILQFTELSDPRYRCDRQDTDAREVVEQSIHDVQKAIKDRGLCLIFKCSPRLGRLPLNRSLMKTALTGLMTNAILFNRPKGRITVEAGGTASEFTVSVTDTGFGISPEHLAHMSEIFYQASSYLTREVGGLGLGLALARRISELHGGRLTFRSKKGQGSTFALTLPRTSSDR